MVRHWLNLSLWSLILEDLTDWPAQPLGSHLVTTIWLRSDRLLGMGWNGSWACTTLLISTTLRLFRDGSQSLKMMTRARRICRCTAWRLRTLLCTAVRGSHSDRRGWGSKTEQRPCCSLHHKMIIKTGVHIAYTSGGHDIRGKYTWYKKIYEIYYEFIIIMIASVSYHVMSFHHVIRIL